MSPHSLIWSGATSPHLDDPAVTTEGRAIFGRFGGSRAHGASKNEDGALIWSGEDWVFAMILDGHGGSSSVDAVLASITASAPQFLPLCIAGDFQGLQAALIRHLTGPAFREAMASVRGETACLIAYQRGGHLLWVSIGDNTLYLLHPELAALGQHALTVRNFYEWVGERNSLAGTPPCFSTGIRELRHGHTSIALITDGLQEMPGAAPDLGPVLLEKLRGANDPAAATEALLATAQASGAKDSCTIIAWSVDNLRPGLMPSA